MATPAVAKLGEAIEHRARPLSTPLSSVAECTW